MELMRCSSSTLNRVPLCCRGTTTNHLPDAILIEIFLRLSLKSAKLCTVVSKHWYALISTSDFGNRFLQLNYISTLLISHKVIRYDDYSLPRKMKLFVSSEHSIFRSRSFSMSNLPYKPPIAVVGSCGDLLLLCPDINLHSVYYICNPLTAKWFPLLPAPISLQKILQVHIGFIFQGHGISFKYAVVRLPCSYGDDGGGAVKIGIFTSDSRIWSEKVWTRRPKVPGFPLQNLAGIPYNGMLFWISGYVADNSRILVGVDPFSESETLHFKALPCSPPTELGSQNLAVCRGILKLLETDMNDTKNDLSIRVWDLQDFLKNEWYLKHRINFSGLQSEYPSCFGDRGTSVCPIACDGDIMYILVEQRVVLLCNMHKKTLDVIPDKLILPNRIIGAFVYVVPWQPTAIPSLLN